MRVSVRIDDPGFRSTSFQCEVFLDNETIKLCFTADEELGEAHCFKTDDEGNLVLAEDKQSMQTIIRKGVVRVVTPLNFIGKLRHLV
jgi:hypothetical protein